MNAKHNSLGERIFDILNYTFLGLVGLCTILPFIYIFAASFASEAEVTGRQFFLIPREWTLDSYKFIFSTNTLFRSIGVSVYVTVVGTLVNLLFTVTMAYPLSRKDLLGRNTLLNMVLITMLFSGGLIPTYLVVKSVGLLDSFWAMILPGAISAFTLVIVKNFFQALPDGLIESARIDGCSEIGVLWRIVLPLSKPVLATFGLFYAVGHWDDFFSALLYINDSEKWPLQLLLREIVMQSQSSIGDQTEYLPPPDQSIKMSVIVVGTVPILLVYPFLQKHFAKGVLVGSIKG